MTENQSHYCVGRTAKDLSSEARAVLTRNRAAVLKNARWQPGATISIRFLAGSSALQTRVRDVALEWTRIANLMFQFVTSAPTDIRIAFDAGNGSWSYIGTICRSIPEPRPTMNYGWLTDASPDDEVRRVVLHEFGHAIGLIHEHQNPEGGIEWNKAAVKNDLGGPPNSWDDSTIETNMFKHYEKSEVIGTPVDALSIMMYPIPKAWTMNGFSAGLNAELSDTDKRLVGEVYPK